MMRPEVLTASIRRRPFIPLRVHMTDGRAYKIRRPEAMLVSRSHAVVVLRQHPETGVVDRCEYPGPIQIGRVEEWPSPMAAGKAS